MENKPQLYIPRKVFNKIMFWVDKCPLEVSGMGIISYDESKHFFYVRDVFLLEQEVTSSTTDIDPKALGKLEHELYVNKVKGDLNFWWHSHVNMAVFWSSQDKDTITQMGSQGYCVATVFNKKREMRSALCAKYEANFGLKSTVFVDELQTIIHDPLPSQSELSDWTKQYEERVKEKEYNYSKAYPVHGIKNSHIASHKNKTPSSTVAKDIDINKWKSPAPWMVTNLKNQFKVLDVTNSKELKELDKEWIVSAATIGVSLNYMSYLEEYLDYEHYSVLDDFYKKFNENNPKFDWSLT